MHIAKTYNDLLSTNRQFLKGLIRATPWHYGPIDDETYPLIKILVKINKHILTTCSQPHTENQRAYIEAIVPNELIDKLLQLDRSKYIIITWKGNQPRTIHGDYKELVIDLKGEPCINLTRERYLIFMTKKVWILLKNTMPVVIT